ncbi:MAG: hypothetical protein K2X87_21185 [Gemmataceae bacterium]|nr:hypothetical protein [Gemmataceae bacterium]
MRRLGRAAAVTLAAGFAFALSGCGGGTATVGGTVTYRGRPVPGGSVVLYCGDKQIVRGLIGPDGTYSIPNVPRGQAVATVQTHARVPDGLRFKQTLPPVRDGPVPPEAAPRGADKAMAIPPRYALPEESGLAVVVGPGPMTFDIPLSP